MKRYDLIVVGAGPAGLSAAIQAARYGAKTAVFDENASPGGQLFKQIHKFFGSKEHHAKVRGFNIGKELLREASDAGVTVHLNAVVMGIYDNKEILVNMQGETAHYKADTICMAVGLSPMSQLTSMIKCRSEDRGGTVPQVNQWGETSIPGIYAAGDVAGIEEASSAMINGRIAGTAAAERLGYIGETQRDQEVETLRASLKQLHEGMFSPENKGRADLTVTDEGISLSQSLLKKGYVADDEIQRFPGVKHAGGIHPVIECTQNIPCNPCQDACKFGCIKVGDQITRLPEVDGSSRCTGCGMCVASCSGQAIFLVDEDAGGGWATVTMPYELLPYPQAGETGAALGRDGSVVCQAQVVSCRTSPAFDRTALLTIQVPRDMAMKARFFRREEDK